MAQGNKTRSVSKLTVAGVVRSVSWSPVFQGQKNPGKITKAQKCRLPVLLFVEVPKKCWCSQAWKRRKDAIGGEDPEEQPK